MRVLYVADDYGYWPSVDRAIEALAREGAIDAVSLLVTSPGLRDLAALRELPGLQIGLHLDLTWGSPLSGGGLVESLGQPRALAELSLRALFGRLRRDRLAAEVEAQLERLISLAGRVDHLDGHQHVHLLPGVFAACCEAIAERLPRVRLRMPFMGWGPSLRALSLSAAVSWRRAEAALASRPLPFDALPFFIDFDDAPFPSTFDGAAEVMLHVAHPELPDPRLDHTSYSYRGRVDQFSRRMAERRVEVER